MRDFSGGSFRPRGEFVPRERVVDTRAAAGNRRAQGARTPAYAQQGRRWEVSNELIASAALLGLVCIVLFGPIAVLTFIGATGLLVVQRPKQNLAQLLRFSPFLLLPLLAMLSSQWSPLPAATMRASLQLWLTFAAAIIIARNISPERMILVLFVGYAIICIWVLPGVPTSLATKAPLVNAALGSKNQVSFSAYMVAVLGLALAIDGSQRWWVRVSGIAAIPAAVGMIYLAQSGGGTSSLVMAFIVLPCLAALGWFKLGGRVAVLIFAIGVFVIALVFLKDIELALTTFRTETLQKDATLTGRTYLWEFAERLSAKHRWLGLGYGAFWQQGNIDAEGLWRWGGIANRSGFNFHNAFVEIKVDLGLVGQSLLYVTCAVIGIAGLVRQFTRPTPAMAGLIGLMVVGYVRSYVEDGLVAPFSTATLIWIAVAVYAFAPRLERVGTNLVAERSRKS